MLIFSSFHWMINHLEIIIKYIRCKLFVQTLLHIDDQLRFNLHISNICKSASKQLNALVRLKSFLGFEGRNVLINSFILSNFNYCPFVWSISSGKSLNKVENLQNRALRFLHNNNSSSYEELSKKVRKTLHKCFQPS